MRFSFLGCMQNGERKVRVFEGFAGYGGASFGLKRAGISHEVIGFSEIDKWANKIFRLNHPNIPDLGDITLIDQTIMPDFDLFTGGFLANHSALLALAMERMTHEGLCSMIYCGFAATKNPATSFSKMSKGF
jgi:hypothetical protein